MNLLEKVKEVYPTASDDQVDTLIWMTPYPFVENKTVIESIDQFRNKFGPNIADAIEGGMIEFDITIQKYKGEEL